MEITLKAKFKYMRIFKIIGVFFILLSLGCSKKIEDTSSEDLNTIIIEIEEREFYNKEEYPLGLFSKEIFEKEALYAKEQLGKLKEIDIYGLSETELISLELLKFKLQDTIDYFKYESYLNPLLSDSGFHTSFSFMVRPFNNYEQVKEYLKKLNASQVE
jgi:uncharacterized protein (DUF885 family)